MNKNVPVFQSLRFSVCNFEMLQEAVKGSDLNHVQLESGVLHGDLLRLEVGPLCIDYGQYNLGVLAQGQLPADRCTIGMIIDCRSSSKYFKRDANFGDVVFFPHGCELDVLLGKHPQWCTLSFEKLCFEDACLKKFPESACDVNGRKAFVVGRSTFSIRLMQLVRTVLFSEKHMIYSTDCTTANENLLEELLELSINSVFNNHRCSHRVCGITRAQTVSRAEDVLNSVGQESMLVTELAEMLNVSLRTLEYSFKETYGISPKRYLNIRKLNVARQKILSYPNHSITDHATSSGYWHMSQFAQDYKKLFGELPSETLRLSRQKT